MFNSDDGGLFHPSRGGRVNLAFNEHYIEICQSFVKSKHRSGVNYLIHYKDVPLEKIVYIPKTLDEKMFNLKIKNALKYPEDIEQILAISD